MLFGTRWLIGKLSNSTIPFLDRDLSPSTFFKDLGVVFDSNLYLDSHVNDLSSLIQGKRCQINSARHLFTKMFFQSFWILKCSANYLLFHCVVRNNTTEYPETAAITEFNLQNTNWKKKIWSHFHNHQRPWMSSNNEHVTASWSNHGFWDS